MGDIALYTSDELVDAATKTIQGADTTSDVVVEVLGSSAEFAGEIAVGIVGFIADALS